MNKYEKERGLVMLGFFVWVIMIIIIVILFTTLYH